MTGLSFQTRDTDATLACAAALADAIRALAPASVVIELQGDLGSGKTVFVRGLARALGVAADARVVSPTFTIARSYPLGVTASAGGLHTLHHLDAYRLSGPEDLEVIGFEEMCGNGCLTCVEWGEYVAASLPEDRLRMQLQPLPPPDLVPGEAPECPRDIRVEALGPASDRLLAAWRTAQAECRAP